MIVGRTERSGPGLPRRKMKRETSVHPVRSFRGPAGTACARRQAEGGEEGLATFLCQGLGTQRRLICGFSSNQPALTFINRWRDAEADAIVYRL